jgi:Flp pilus assembly protein TadG
MKETIIQKTHEKGQALMELAVSITVLFIIVAGVVDIGRMLFHYITMRDAAQEAAAYGSIYPTHCDQIRDRAWIAMASSPFVTVTTTIDGVDCTTAAADPARACYGKEIRVSLSDPEFPITMPFIGTFIGSQSVSLEADITGTILRPACQ